MPKTNTKPQMNYSIGNIAEALHAEGKFNYRGFDCLISINNLSPTGYIVLDNQHHQRLANNKTNPNATGMAYDWMNLKQEITLDTMLDGQRVIGFDTAHSMDYVPRIDLDEAFLGKEMTDDEIKTLKLPEYKRVWTIYDVKDALCEMVDYLCLGRKLYPNSRKMAWLNNEQYSLYNL